eukprot:CAMPEP_0194191476 /NCGR_PEP_ID=MMETSP0154-20130528/66908_1 /TAXON_ID=1049557 /ORGANISM="Thalassiothrix antarctica, Strain L6-D1" /LENGTH=174 /DNA_ID=CAMNT_0038914153 /DNA_START=411 /DNA_END=932 /DNA_ORIENTATION=+
MNLSLHEAQRKEDEELTEEIEQLSADVQRKGCLWMGALVDGNKQLATRVVDEGGLRIILAAIDWYRYHEDVNNWGLWAIFMLCYEHLTNKIELVRLGGLQILCQSILNNSDSSLEVCRHGIAVLFDLLQNTNIYNTINDHNGYDVMKVRQVAVSVGLHNAVYKAMLNYPESSEI